MRGSQAGLELGVEPHRREARSERKGDCPLGLPGAEDQWKSLMGQQGGQVIGEPAATGVGGWVCDKSRPGSGRSREVHGPGRTLRLREVILMSPEGTDLGIPPEE